MDYSKFDYVLVVDNSLDESQTDKRVYNKNLPSVDYNPQGSYIGVRDLKLMQSWSFGKMIQRDLSSMGNGYSCRVFDVGGEVAVTVTHTDAVTGRSASKSFIIVFDSKSGNGIIKSSSTRWRSISGIGQAESYIRSVASGLQSFTQSNS